MKTKIDLTTLPRMKYQKQIKDWTPEKKWLCWDQQLATKYNLNVPFVIVALTWNVGCGGMLTGSFQTNTHWSGYLTRDFTHISQISEYPLELDEPEPLGWLYCTKEWDDQEKEWDENITSYLYTQLRYESEFWKPAASLTTIEYLNYLSFGSPKEGTEIKVKL